MRIFLRYLSWLGRGLLTILAAIAAVPTGTVLLTTTITPSFPYSSTSLTADSTAPVSRSMLFSPPDGVPTQMKTMSASTIAPWTSVEKAKFGSRAGLERRCGPP